MEVSKTQLIAHHVWVAACSFTKLSVLYLRSAGDPSHSQLGCSKAWLSRLRCSTKFSQKNDYIHWCSKIEDKAEPDTSGIRELKIYCLLRFSDLCLDWAHSGATPDRSAAPGAPGTPEADSGFRTRFKSSLAVSRQNAGGRFQMRAAMRGSSSRWHQVPGWASGARLGNEVWEGASEKPFGMGMSSQESCITHLQGFLCHPLLKAKGEFIAHSTRRSSHQGPRYFSCLALLWTL